MLFDKTWIRVIMDVKVEIKCMEVSMNEWVLIDGKWFELLKTKSAHVVVSIKGVIWETPKLFYKCQVEGWKIA